MKRCIMSYAGQEIDESEVFTDPGTRHIVPVTPELLQEAQGGAVEDDASWTD